MPECFSLGHFDSLFYLWEGKFWKTIVNHGIAIVCLVDLVLVVCDGVPDHGLGFIAVW